MSTPSDIPVSSINSIKATIKSDDQVYRWFSYLLSQPSIKDSIKNKSKAKPLIQKLQNQYLFNYIILGLIFLTLVYFSLSGNTQILFCLLFFLPVMAMLYRARKDLISQISTLMLMQNFDEKEINIMTLYQLSEKLSKEFNISSLVDVTYHLDRICRNAFLALFVGDLIVYVFIYKFNIWPNIVFIITLYISIVLLVNSPLIYKKLN